MHFSYFLQINNLIVEGEKFKPFSSVFVLFCFFFLESFNLWRPLLMIALYHQTKTSISFLCRRRLNPISFIQPSETLPVDLAGLIVNPFLVGNTKECQLNYKNFDINALFMHLHFKLFFPISFLSPFTHFFSTRPLLMVTYIHALLDNFCVFHQNLCFAT